MKKAIMIIIPLTIVICIAISLVIYFNSNQYKEGKLEKTFKKLGSSYYEDYYYPTIGLDKIRTSKSIVITLDTIKNTNVYQDNDSLGYFENCDQDNTFVKITPIDPYKATDYKLDIKLDCELIKQKK